MKKTSLFLILIFSVFFSFQTAFAYTSGTITIDPATHFDTGFSLKAILSTGTVSGKLCSGSDYGTCAGQLLSYSNFAPYISAGWFDSIGTTLQFPIDQLFNGGYSYSLADGSYYMQFTQSGSDFVVTFSKVSGVYYGSAALIPLDGISSQLTPVASSTVPYNVNFTGTYDNYYGTYRYIIAQATTGTPTIYSSASSEISTGVSLSYDFNLLLSPNQTYNYQLQLCTASGYPCTTYTTSVSFSTSGLTVAISPPVWTAESCTWTDFSTWTGCLDNVFHNLFSPSTESITQYQGLYAEFIHKPPFGYVVAIQTALSGINDTASSAFTLQSMPILNTYIFTPIYDALEWVLWVAFAFVLYHRLKNIQL